MTSTTETTTPVGHLAALAALDTARNELAWATNHGLILDGYIDAVSAAHTKVRYYR